MGQLLTIDDLESSLNSISCDQLQQDNYIQSDVVFEYSTMSSKITILFPQSDTYVIEHKMLGEDGDIKSEVDDDLLDAMREISSNITGAISNSINAQDNEDLNGVKLTVDNTFAQDQPSLENCEQILHLKLTNESNEFNIYIMIDSSLKKFFDNENSMIKTEVSRSESLTTSESNNLELLMDVELRLSVRLGGKEMLLKDIVKLDLGDIIELDQLVNDPLDILVNGKKIAEGEAVVVDGNFAIKIRNVGSIKERLSYVRLAH